jgi:hypothetical protein
MKLNVKQAAEYATVSASLIDALCESGVVAPYPARTAREAWDDQDRR